MKTFKPDAAIDHPHHYTAHPSGVECIDIVEHLSFNVGNAIKYLWRAGLKGALVEDLKKARWYVDREIQRLEALDASKTDVDHFGRWTSSYRGESFR